MSKKSWIKPSFDFECEDGRLAVILDPDSHDLVSVLASGYIILNPPHDPANAWISCHQKLDGLLWDIYQGLDTLKPPENWINSGEALRVFLNRIYHSPKDDTIILILSLTRLEEVELSFSALQKLSKDAWDHHLKKVDDWDNEVKKHQEDAEAREARLSSITDPLRQEWERRSINISYASKPSPPLLPILREIIDMDSLKDFLDPVVWVTTDSTDETTNINVLSNAIEDSPLEASRDGCYKAIYVDEIRHSYRLGNATDEDSQNPGFLVTWNTIDKSPSFPEIRSSSLKVVPSAFDEPLQRTMNPPRFQLETRFEGDLRDANISILDENLQSNDLEDIFDWELDDFENQGKQGREIFAVDGFEALGWYQSYHVWSEETWGIYLHAERLHAFACGLHQDLIQVSEGVPALAALLAVGLIYHHELFHAKIDSVATWLELLSQQPRYRTYHSDVYLANRFSERWLEESLANWTAFSWLDECLPKWKDLSLVHNADKIKRVVADWLDKSPEGYRHWKQGDSTEAWRTLSSQIATGMTNGICGGEHLPTESLLNGELPFDFRRSDVPTRFVGHNSLSDIFFSTPSRKEAEKMLKSRKYRAEPKRGKGSHILWCGPDGRNFPLPQKDPLSPGVFHSLLEHFDLTKKKYVNEVRVQL